MLISDRQQRQPFTLADWYSGRQFNRPSAIFLPTVCGKEFNQIGALNLTPDRRRGHQATLETGAMRIFVRFAGGATSSSLFVMVTITLKGAIDFGQMCHHYHDGVDCRSIMR